MVCENRGTGLLAVSAALRDSGLEPTVIRDSLAEFRAVLYREPILDEAARTWLGTLPLSGITAGQRLGLAYLAQAAHHHQPGVPGADGLWCACCRQGPGSDGSPGPYPAGQSRQDSQMEAQPIGDRLCPDV